jgi:colicin import membrane protein
MNANKLLSAFALSASISLFPLIARGQASTGADAQRVDRQAVQEADEQVKEQRRVKDERDRVEQGIVDGINEATGGPGAAMDAAKETGADMILDAVGVNGPSNRLRDIEARELTEKIIEKDKAARAIQERVAEKAKADRAAADAKAVKEAAEKAAAEKAKAEAATSKPSTRPQLMTREPIEKTIREAPMKQEPASLGMGVRS